PYFEGYPDTNTVCLGGWLLGINVNSQHKEEVWKFIEYLTSHEAQLRTAAVTGNLPTRQSVYEDSRLVEQFPVANKQYEDFMVGNVRPSAQLGEKYTQVSEIMQREIQSALLRLKTPQRALDDAVSQINALLR
ncbi:MAG: extracellular solute-binding protein, partial [Thermotogota bacterium]|nr:extracellular solute-binding protein [Thermotogota bacterium]